MTEQQTRNAITLKGSAELVTDYLKYGINSILYQRGIYPPESFKNEEHFGLTILVSTDDKINGFLHSVLSQIKGTHISYKCIAIWNDLHFRIEPLEEKQSIDWLLIEKIKKLSLVITNITTKEVLERWDFKLEYEKPKSGDKSNGGKEEYGNKDLKVIQKEIRDVLRQICSTVSFLPLLDCPCAFDLLIYTPPDIDVPELWGETAPCFIANSQEIQLRSFSTSLHRMDTVVSYKADC